MPSIGSSAMPLRWLSETQRTRLAARIADACADVLKDWSARGNSESLTVHHVSDAKHEQLAGTTFHVVSGADVLLTWTLSAEALRQILALPHGTFVERQQKNGVLVDLEFDFVTALSQALMPSELNGQWQVRKAADKSLGSVTRAKRALQHWLQLTVDDQAACCQLVMSTRLVDHLMPRAVRPAKKALSPRLMAIAEQALTLSASLGQIEVPFKELQRLAVGDVLVMPSSLAALVTVVNAKGQRIADGALGRQGRQLAVCVSGVESSTPAKAQFSEKRSVR